MRSSPCEQPIGDILDFLHRLDDAGIRYRLEHVRDAIMVVVAVPGERWEIEFFADGHVEVERFISNGEIEDAEALDRLLKAHRS